MLLVDMRTRLSGPLLILLLLGTATHFFWLGYPAEVVFDEVHFGKFISAYCCTGERFFDIHPPHAKLLIAGTAKLAGYDGSFSFESIGQDYGAVSAIPLRLFSALTGVMLIGVMYGLLRALGVGQAAAFLGGLVVLLDNALTVQTRLMALDGLLLVGTFGSLAAYLVIDRLVRERVISRELWWYAILTGLLMGLAVGTKFTGLAAVGLIGLIIWVRLLTSVTRQDVWLWMRLGLVILAVAGVVYVGGWIVHFALLTESGPGDAWRVPQWDRPLVVSFVKEMREWHGIMYRANRDLTAGHHDASLWWTWPAMQTPVFYWNYTPSDSAVDDRVGSIYFLGNPVVWWGATILFVVFVLWWVERQVNWFYGRVYKKKDRSTWWPQVRVWTRSNMYWIVLLGFIISYGPLTQVPRALFIYHYLTPLLFTVLFVVMWFEHIGFITRQSIKQQPARYWFLIGVLLAGFVVFSPLTYGFLLDSELHDRLFWFSGWR